MVCWGDVGDGLYLRTMMGMAGSMVLKDKEKAL